MPVPNQSFRIDPRDLNANVAIGISLPFNAPNVFNPTFSTQDQVKYNMINLLLTNKGERVFNPDFGSNAKRHIFEFITDDNVEGLKNMILGSISTYIPEVILLNVEVTPDPDSHLITLRVDYQLILSGNKDTVLIQFQ